jgi:hypothetical protein
VNATEKPKLDERFIKEIDGKQFVLYSGILDLAHKKGLNRIEVEILQYPTSDNNMTAICKAAVESKDGDLFVDCGDANPTNCNHAVSRHLLRMASTRAKARALRDFTNIGMTAYEELADASEVLGNDNPATPTTGRTRGRKPKETAPQSGSDDGESGANPTKKISEAQKQAILNLSRRRGLTLLELEKLIKETYGSPFTEISQRQASALIHSFQQKRKSA